VDAGGEVDVGHRYEGSGALHASGRAVIRPGAASEGRLVEAAR
jgi:hypothetical protein